MELWIRSQDKTRLFQSKSLQTYKNQDNDFVIVTAEFGGVAKYNSLERCLEIIDEIQTVLTKTVITYTKGITKEEYESLNKDLHKSGVICLPNGVDIKSLDIDTFVYQMPEE